MRFASLLSAATLLGAAAVAQTPLDHAIDSPASMFTYSGSTTLGPIVGSPNTFNLSGTLVAEYTGSAAQRLATISFPGGGDALVAPDIDAQIPNPVPFLPPLARITIAGLRLDVSAAAVPVDAAGNFTANVVSTAVAGMATVTPLGGAPSMTDLSGSMSTPQPFSGNVSTLGTSITVAGPLSASFQLTDPGTGLTATVNLMGTLSAAYTAQGPTIYCVANANSSGASAGIGWTGSPSLFDADLTLTTNGLPQNSLGFYFFGNAQGFVMNFAATQGNLCLGGLIFRLSNFVQSSGAVGQVSLLLPSNGAGLPTMIDIGDTWNFQYWYRDALGGVPVSNTSDGLSVTFVP